MVWSQLFFLAGIFVGLLGLWWSSDKSVEYSLELSDLFGIKTFFVGFVLMAVATGLPELSVSIVSLWSGVQEVAVGTIIGSNLSDISLVLGVPALFIGPLYVAKTDITNLMLMFVITSLVMGFVFIWGVLPVSVGYILIFLYFLCIWWLWKTRLTEVVSEKVIGEELSGQEISWWKKWLWGNGTFWMSKFGVIIKLFIALFFVLFTSRIAIYSAVHIAEIFNIGLGALGATIFAIGTSLPELALSIQATKRKKYGLAFGNAFGSILEQATLILGVLVIGASRAVDIRSFRFIAPLMFMSYAIVGNSLLKRKKLGRREGVILLLLFSIHVIYYLFFNGR